MPENEKKEIKPETYRGFINRGWSDIHHSRLQEWSALGIVTGIHLGIVHLLKFINGLSPSFPFENTAVFGCASCIVFSVLGALLTCRHRRLMRVKLSWIYQAEEKLGLVRKHDEPDGIIPENKELGKDVKWKGLMWPRFLSTGWLMLCIYAFLIILDISGIILFKFFM